MTEPASTPRITVLAVDDEPMVLDVLATVLTRAGFEVLRASGGKEALAQFSEHSSRVACAIVDRNMPELDGFAVANELRRRRSDLPLVISSGQAALDTEFSSLLGAPPLMLRKPYRGAALVEIVRQALGVAGDA